MKRLPILLAILTLPALLFAQNISVKSFQALPTDMTARVTDPVKDQNGDKSALIRVVTTQTGFKWEAGMMGIVKAVHKTGEYWLYIPYGSKKLTIMHPQLGVLRNYLYPVPIEEAGVYELVLTTGKVTTIVTDIAAQKQWLTIKTDPPGATVYLNEEIQSKLTPFGKKLDLGRYSYRIEYAEYHNEAGFVELTADKKAQLEIELQPAFGQLHVNSQPEEGAVVVIDGKPTGKQTPCTIEHIPSGTHTLRLMKDMYAVSEQDFDINDGQTTTLNINLNADFGQIKVKGEEVDIYIDGEYKAKNTWSGRISPGIHRLEGKKEKHYSDVQSFEIAAGDDKSLALTPIARTGNIDIMSTPMDARISIDGKDYGLTPNTVNKLIIGNHNLQLSKEGFGTINKTISIAEGETLEINEELPSGKEITISSTPSGATLNIDGQSYGTTPWTGTLAFGSHDIKLVNGKKTVNQQISISQNGKSSFSYDVRVGKKISINSTPSGATLNIDGQSYGTTPWRGTLAFGVHDIKLVNGKKTVNQQISISQNGKSSFSYDLSEFGNFTETVNGVPFTMVAVKGGCFQMGSNESSDEKPVHEVCLDDYYIGQTEVTQGLWKAVMNNNPSYFKGDNLPVESVSWDDAQEFIKKLNRITGKNFRLPTEAEWEYAAKGGVKTHGRASYTYAGSNNIDEVAWYGSNSGSKTHTVAQKKANALGLYDMSGNVWEWCSDRYGSAYYQNSPRHNPQGPSSGSYRVLRGGCWYNLAQSCRSADRDYGSPGNSYYGLGFRLASSLK